MLVNPFFTGPGRQGLLNEEYVGRWRMLPYTYNLLKDRGALPDRFDGFVQRDLVG